MEDMKLSDLKTSGVIFGPKLGDRDSFIVFHEGKFRNFELSSGGKLTNGEVNNPFVWEFGYQVFKLIDEMKEEDK